MTDIPATRGQSPEVRNKLIKAGSFHWFHWVIIGTSLALTIGAWKYSDFQATQKIEERFQREADHVVELVEERMELYENALWGGVAYIDATDGQTTANEWSAYAESLRIDQTYPGINGIGIIYNIKKSELEAYLKKQIADRPNYEIHPSHQQSEYWPITYIEPVASNRKAVGLDMAFEANRYSGILKARDTGLAQLTGPIILVQDAKKTPGFLFYTPFYKNGTRPTTIEQRQKEIIGVTYAPFIMYKLMEGTLAKHKRLVSVTIKDAGELLYDDNAGEGNSGIDLNPMFKKTIEAELYGRTWIFDVHSNLQFRNQADLDQPYLILIAGIVIEVLIISLFVFLIRANRQALAYADEMTEELEIKAIHLQKSNEDLDQFAYVASHDLKSPLNGIRQVVGWIEEDCKDILPEESKEHLSLLRSRAQRAMNLLSDLLDYSRIGRIDMTVETFELAAVVNNIIEIHTIPEGFSCTAPPGEMTVCKTALELVLRNLISNALKHHDRDTGQINITLDEKDQVYTLIVEDDGPGIPPELHQKALEMFQTLQSRDTTEGSGMGLALVNKTIDNHSGSLSIDSNGRGTRMVIKWPMEKRS